MPRNARQVQTRVAAGDRGRIGVTDSTCLYPNTNLTPSRLRDRPFHYSKHAGCGDFHCFVCTLHLCVPFICISLPLNDNRVVAASMSPQSFSLSIHSRIYEGQFSSFTPSVSQRARKPITSRSTTPTSFKSKTMSQKSDWSSKSLLNSAIACVSIRPLRRNTVNPPRTALSILKVIDQPHRSRGSAALHSFHPNIDHWYGNANRVPDWISLKTGLEMKLE